jgi:hypothetical protein
MEAEPEIVLFPGSCPVEVATNVSPFERVKVNVSGMALPVPGVLVISAVMFPNGLNVPEPEPLRPLGILPVPWPVALMEI